MDAQQNIAMIDDIAIWKRWAVVLPFFAFGVPLLVSGPQWLTGTLVNAFLFIAAVKLPRATRWPVILLPSVAAVLHGVLFQSFTPFLALFLPFIWIGNAVLVESFIALERTTSTTIAVLLSAIAKAAFLFLCAFILFQAHIVPAIFLTAMGILQLVTALAGGIIAFLIVRIGSVSR